MEMREKIKRFSIVLSVLRITAYDYLFIFSLFSIVLSVLRITASHYLFIFSLFSIVLSVLRITASDYLFIFSRQYNGKERKDQKGNQKP
jgi:hypothetical protein